MWHRHIGLCAVRDELQIFLNSISHWTWSSPIPKAADGQCPGMQPCPPPGAGVRRLCCRDSFTCLGRSKLRPPSLYEYFTDWRSPHPHLCHIFIKGLDLLIINLWEQTHWALVVLFYWLSSMCQPVFQVSLLIQYPPGSWFYSLALTEGTCIGSQSSVLKATPTEQLSRDLKSPTYS